MLDRSTWIFIIAVIVLVIVPAYNATSLHHLQEQAVDQNDLIVRVVNENNQLIKHTNEHLINHTEAATNNTKYLIDSIHGLNITEVNQDLGLSKQNSMLLENLTAALRHIESEVQRVHGAELKNTSSQLHSLKSQVEQVAELVSSNTNTNAGSASSSGTIASHK